MKKQKTYITLTEPYIKEDNKLWSLIPQLLFDHSTCENIIFANDCYEGHEFSEQMTEASVKELLLNMKLKPRQFKTVVEQKDRTKKKAEVFTPSWICKEMIDMCELPTNWEELVLATCLEITCGEAPYITNRYDTTTGEIIPIEKRIGILDRKLMAINKNVNDKDEWLKWVLRAIKTTYGYEWQGDNLFIARVNVLRCFFENYVYKWHEKPDDILIKRIINIIVWNFWQMDGLKDVIPMTNIPAKIRDWKVPKNEQIIEFRSLKPEKEEKPKKCRKKKE